MIKPYTPIENLLRRKATSCITFRLGWETTISTISITVSVEEEVTEVFSTIRNDLEGMIRSLVERKEGKQFDCCLQESEMEAIREARASLSATDEGIMRGSTASSL